MLEDHTGSVNAVSITPDGKQAISGSSDNIMYVWDLATGACLNKLIGHTDMITTISVTPDGRWAISGGWDKTLRFWDLEIGICLKMMEGHAGSVNTVAITPDGKRAVSGSSDNTLRLWNLELGTCLMVLEGHTDRVNTIAISPDGMRAVSGSDHDCLRVWDLTTGACLDKLNGVSVITVSISHNCMRAISGSWDEKMRVWDLTTGTCQNELNGHTNHIHAVSITPDGRRAISGSRDNTLRVWDLETGACLKTLEGHTYGIKAVSITPDGRRAVSGGADGTLRVWDLENGVCRTSKDGHMDLISTVSIIPDGTRAVTGSAIRKLTFNLSQFSGGGDLVDALHQVRDAGLTGQIPLVFWDEFDTALGPQKLGWLRYFLAPMQDGVFQDGQITHHIGRAIFVFAGGTRARMEDFARPADEAAFKDAKGPDFLSRLKGYVNILGPNPLDIAYAEGDPHYLIRRAILLRNLLGREAKQLFSESDGTGMANIDPGVLRAFLYTRRYKHGVRSMEAVIAMSMLARKNCYERSCLPSEAQLNLHVDGLEFLALVQQPEFEVDQLDRMAPMAHEVYCESLKDDPNPPPNAKLSFEELGPEEQRQNRENVRDIPRKLSAVGYVVIPARDGRATVDFPETRLEILAEMEHDRWVRSKLDRGWRYQEQEDRANLLTPCLLPWRTLSPAEREQLEPKLAAAYGPGELPKEEKDKDRAMVRGIPRILAAGGYALAEMAVE